MDKHILGQIIIEQQENFGIKGDFVTRIVRDEFLSTPKISVITGVRRSGKSTLLKLISDNYGKYCYFNFEDERLLDFTHQDFSTLLELYYEIYETKPEVFFFDEIQNVYGWEKFAGRIFSEGKKVFITGSNSKMLSSELSSSLTGRYLKTELYPFSFREYLSYHKAAIQKFHTSVEKANIKKHFQTFMEYGGFPEVVKTKSKNELTQLYQDVLVNDIIVRFKIKDTKRFRELALYLLSNISSLYSYNSLSKFLNIKSPMTVMKNIGFLEEAYLFISVPKYDYSLKKQVRNNRKIYTIDTGIFNAVSFSFSENKGKQLENIVLLELKRRGFDVYYFKAGKECDFIAVMNNKIRCAIQVTENFTKKNEAREVDGLVEAMENHRISKGYILTYDQTDELIIKKKKLTLLPIWKWLLLEN